MFEEKFRKFIILLLVIVFILLLVFPIYSYWMPELDIAYIADNDEAYWNSVYLWQDDFIPLFTFPLYFLFPLYLYSKNRIWKIIIQIFILLGAGLCFLMGMAMGMSAQDFSPDLGGLLLLTILPLFGILFYYSYIVSKEKEQNK